MNKNMKINIKLPKSSRKARNRRNRRRDRIPLPYREGNLVFGPGKTSLLFHKDETFVSEMVDLYVSSIMSDNASELAWAMSAFQFYKIVKVDVIVNPGPSSGIAYIGFYWSNQVINDAQEFTQSDTTKVCVFPCWKPKIFSYYPVNAVIMDIGSGYNYKDWIPTTQTSFPGKLYYVNDGTNASFRVQILIKFRGSKTKTISGFVNMFNQLSSTKLILEEEKKEEKKDDKNRKEVKVNEIVESQEEFEEEEIEKIIKNRNKSKRKSGVEKDNIRPNNNVQH